MSIFNIKRYGEEELNEDPNNELELLKKLKRRIAAQKNVTKTSSSTDTEKLEKSQENEENLQKEPKDNEGIPEENDHPSTEGKKKRKRKRKSSISNESATGFTSLGDVASKEKSKVRRVLPKMVSATRYCVS